MDESNMTVLTQEEFDNMMSEHGFPIIENRIIDGLVYDHTDWYCAVKFKNCIIKSLKMNMYQVNAGFLMCNIDHIDIWVEERVFSKVALVKSVINDYRNVKYRYKAFHMDPVIIMNPLIIDCTFLKPVPLACPSEGAFIGWKKCLLSGGLDTCLVKLLIPSDAKRSSAFGTKCRCSKAKVLGIYSSITDNELDNRMAYSSWDKTYYKKDEWVYPDSFDENRYRACSNGIHFFMDKEEARRYPI